jgi:hypothetical protein
VASARGVHVVYGQLALVSTRGDLVEMLGRPWETVKRQFRKGNSIPHPGTMHHRNLFETHGTFDESFRMAADYELLLRELKSRDALFVPEVVVVGMQLGGMSNAPSNALLQIQDVARARSQNGIRGFSLSLLWRRYRSLIRSGVSRLVGVESANWLIDCYRVFTGKRRKWTA